MCQWFKQWRNTFVPTEAACTTLYLFPPPLNSYAETNYSSTQSIFHPLKAVISDCNHCTSCPPTVRFRASPKVPEFFFIWNCATTFYWQTVRLLWTKPISVLFFPPQRNGQSWWRHFENLQHRSFAAASLVWKIFHSNSSGAFQLRCLCI